MITTFDEYQKAGGTALTTEEAYNNVEPYAERLIAAYIKTKIPYWRVKSSLEDYGVDFTAVITSQIDYVEAHGGLEAYAGNSDLALKSVTTSGFSYSMSGGESSMFYNVPISPLSKTEIDYLLLSTGLGCRAIW